MGARAACAIVDAALALICTTACIACRGGTLTPTICAENAGEVTVEAEPGTAAGAHATVGAATAGEETAGAATGGALTGWLTGVGARCAALAILQLW